MKLLAIRVTYFPSCTDAHAYYRTKNGQIHVAHLKDYQYIRKLMYRMMKEGHHERMEVHPIDSRICYKIITDWN